MCDEGFFTQHSSVEDETITLSLETWVTNHSVTWRTTPEKQRAPPHRRESIFTCIQNSKKCFLLIGWPCERQNFKLLMMMMMMMTANPRICDR